MSKYAEIIKRLEEATGPDRELDAAIDITLFGGKTVWKQANYTMDMYPASRRPSDIHIGGFVNDSVPFYTSSIDAAIALVGRMLPGWFWRCGRTSIFPNGWAFLAKHAPDHCDQGDEFAAADGKAKTPEIAILLSLFRALEAQERAA